MHITQKLAIQFIKRAEALRIVGKKRDDAALNYFVGAAQVLEILGNADDFQSVAAYAGLILATRGYPAIVETAREKVPA